MSSGDGRGGARDVAARRLDAIVARTRRDLFSPSPAMPAMPALIGAEIECIPVDATSGARCPIERSASHPPARSRGPAAPPTLPVLRRLAAAEGWNECPSAYGAPVFRTPDGGVVSYEPGGQIEFSAPPTRSVTALVTRLAATMRLLRTATAHDGISLLLVGIDPLNGIDTVPLQLTGPRYLAMDAYFAALGSAGACMMRQTAAMQVTLDAGEDPRTRWRLLTSLAPYVTAMFANSPRYAGQRTGWQSTRAMMWRRLDPTRTGLPATGPVDPATAYAAFGLAAPAILWPGATGRRSSFAELLARGDVTEDEWPAHLTTLFPEVRPRRIGERPTFEIRSADAMPSASQAALLVFLVGLAYDREALEAALARVGPPEPGVLTRAAQAGLADPEIGARAAELYELALDGAGRLGTDVVEGATLESAVAFGRRYVTCHRSPADDVAPSPGQPDEGRRPPAAWAGIGWHD